MRAVLTFVVLLLCLFKVLGSSSSSAFIPTVKVEVTVSPVPSSPSYGIQEALNSIPAGGPGWGTNTVGATVRLNSGDYYLTNGAYYSNTFKYSVKIKGSGYLNTRLIYVGFNNVRTNLLKFAGGGNPNGGLDLPGHVEIEDLTMTSTTNDLIAFLCITNDSMWAVRHCNFTGWQITTNQTHGAQISIDGPSPTLPPGNVGIVAGTALDHAGFIDECFFANLAVGVQSFTDHLYARNIKTAFIGGFDHGGDSFGEGTAWPNTSVYSLGSVFLIMSGLNVDIDHVHFYTVNAGISFDANVECFLSHPQWELCGYGYSAFNPSGQFIHIDETSISDDAVAYQILHGPYSRTPTTAINIDYVMRNKAMSSVSFDGNGNIATNWARFSVRTNLMSQPAAGHTPNLNAGFELAKTNTGPVLFAIPFLPTDVADVIQYDCEVLNTGGVDQPVIFPPSYVTNRNDTLRVTNSSFAHITVVPGHITNVTFKPSR